MAAKDPGYNGPDVKTRFPPGHSGPGRTSSAWIRKRLNSAGRSGDKTEREEILDHLLEVAKAWEVRVIGRDGDGELLKVASARDSVEAAKVLFGYDMGKPGDDPATYLLKLAEHLRSVARDQVEIGRGFLGKRLETMKDEEIAAFWRLCERDPQQFLVAAIAALGAATGDAPPPAQLSAPPPAAPTTAQPNTENEALQPEAGTNSSETEGGEG